MIGTPLVVVVAGVTGPLVQVPSQPVSKNIEDNKRSMYPDVVVGESDALSLEIGLLPVSCSICLIRAFLSTDTAPLGRLLRF